MVRFSVQFVLLWWSCIAMAMADEYVKYKDPKLPVGVRVEDLLRRMTLAEKVGQMVQVDRSVATDEVMRNYSIGSVLSGGGSTPLLHASAKDWVKMVNEFQKGSLSSRLGIPMIYGIDAVHGHNNVYEATIFPHNIGLGATRDPELLRRIGDATALEVRATGIPYVFAPCIAVCRDPRWGRCYESYSEDPKIVREMTDIILGLQGENPNSSLKGVPYVAGRSRRIKSTTVGFFLAGPQVYPGPGPSKVKFLGSFRVLFEVPASPMLTWKDDTEDVGSWPHDDTTPPLQQF